MINTPHLDLERMLSTSKPSGSFDAWSEPVRYDLSEKTDREVLRKSFEDNKISSVHDPLEEIIDDLFEYEYPAEKDNPDAREEYAQEIRGQGAQFGEWFHFPWSGSLVRYPAQESHRALRTSRNRDLITKDEQDKLYEGVGAVFGLSVGGSAVRQLALAGIGGTIITADMDRISPSNTNRLEATQLDIGAKKIDVLAKHISHLDPYVKQVLLREGVNQANIKEIIEQYNPSFMVDAVDSLPIKALIRNVGIESSIPVMMATDLGDRSILDVEMNRPGTGGNPFNGRISDEQYSALLNNSASEDEIKACMFAIVGPENASERMLDSVFKTFSGELPGLPQLGSTATLGGVAVARAARSILLDEGLISGRSILDLDQAVSR